MSILHFTGITDKLFVSRCTSFSSPFVKLITLLTFFTITHSQQQQPLQPFLQQQNSSIQPTSTLSTNTIIYIIVGIVGFILLMVFGVYGSIRLNRKRAFDKLIQYYSKAERKDRAEKGKLGNSGLMSKQQYKISRNFVLDLFNSTNYQFQNQKYNNIGKIINNIINNKVRTNSQPIQSPPITQQSLFIFTQNRSHLNYQQIITKINILKQSKFMTKIQMHGHDFFGNWTADGYVVAKEGQKGVRFMFRKIYKESKKSKMNVIGYIDVNGVPIPKITKTKPNKKPQKLTKSTYLIFQSQLIPPNAQQIKGKWYHIGMEKNPEFSGKWSLNFLTNSSNSDPNNIRNSYKSTNSTTPQSNSNYNRQITNNLIQQNLQIGIPFSNKDCNDFVGANPQEYVINMRTYIDEGFTVGAGMNVGHGNDNGRLETDGDLNLYQDNNKQSSQNKLQNQNYRIQTKFSHNNDKKYNQKHFDPIKQLLAQAPISGVRFALR